MRMLYCDKPDAEHTNLAADRPFLPELIWISGRYNLEASKLLYEDPAITLRLTSLIPPEGDLSGYTRKFSEMGKSIIHGLGADLLDQIATYEPPDAQAWSGPIAESFDIGHFNNLSPGSWAEAQYLTVSYLNLFLCVIASKDGMMYVLREGQYGVQRMPLIFSYLQMKEYLKPCHLTYPTTDNKTKSLDCIDIWIQSSKRAKFDGFYTSPRINPELSTRYINLWAGYTIPLERLHSYLEYELNGITLNHAVLVLRESVCGGNPEAYEWLESFLGRMINDPSDPPVVAPWFISHEGTGKDLCIAKALEKLFGEHMFITSNPQNFLGRVVTYSIWHMVFWVNEMDQMSRKKMAIVKGIQSECELRWNKKYLPTLHLEHSPIWLFFTSNLMDPSVMAMADRSLGQSNRRVGVITSSGRLVQSSGQQQFFDKLHAWCEGGGWYALCAYFLNQYLNNRDSYQPRMKIYSEMESQKKIGCMPPVPRFLLNCLHGNSIFPPGGVRSYCVPDSEKEEFKWEEDSQKIVHTRNLYDFFFRSLPQGEPAPALPQFVYILKQQLHQIREEGDSLILPAARIAKEEMARCWFQGRMDVFNCAGILRYADVELESSDTILVEWYGKQLKRHAPDVIDQ